MKTFIVDSFSDQPFKGNPAGVCFPLEPLDESLMQSIAMELGFSETAFLLPLAEGKSGSGEYSIRYFSPFKEIPLCGHATLAASKVLFTQDLSLNNLRLVTGHGVELFVNVEDNGRIIMRFPVYQTHQASVPDELLQAIGIAKLINCVHNDETNIILLEIESAEALANLEPDYQRMLATYDGIHGVLVTARCTDGDYDFHSRFFWPWSGGQEDPVTGGTHTFLAKYWSDRLGKHSMRSFQASARTGTMDVELLGEDELLIKADARIVFQGEWEVGDPSMETGQSNLTDPHQVQTASEES